jgi:citrate lyase subunit beta/citryl-CoA lyase
MAPSHHEIEEAEAILLKAYAADWGPIQHEGNLHDRATYRYYWELLQRGRIQNVELGKEVNEKFFAEAVPA